MGAISKKLVESPATCTEGAGAFDPAYESCVTIAYKCSDAPPYILSRARDNATPSPMAPSMGVRLSSLHMTRDPRREKAGGRRKAPLPDP